MATFFSLSLSKKKSRSLNKDIKFKTTSHPNQSISFDTVSEFLTIPYAITAKSNLNPLIQLLSSSFERSEMKWEKYVLGQASRAHYFINAEMKNEEIKIKSKKNQNLKILNEKRNKQND